MANEKIEILKLLIANRETDFSIRKIAKIRKINYKSAYNIIKELKKQNLITIKELGNISIPKFNNNFSPLVFEAEYERREEIKKDKNLKVIINFHINKITGLSIVLLFGSYVKGIQNKHSDIDFLVISENFTEIQQQTSLIPLPIHLTTITPHEFILMLKSNEFSAVSEAIRKNIIIAGIEEYYRLLKNVNFAKNPGS